jgi:hypothetical protein
VICEGGLVAKALRVTDDGQEDLGDPDTNTRDSTQMLSRMKLSEEILDAY